MTDALRSGTIPPLDGHTVPTGRLGAAPWIDECDAFDGGERILDALNAGTDPAPAGGGPVLAGMAPTSVKVTLRAIRAAASMTLAEALAQDLRFVSRFITRPDVDVFFC